MTDLPPFPDAWSPLHLTLDGHGGGVLTIGAATYHVRGWQRLNPGQARAEIQGVRDEKWEAYLAALDATVRA